MKKEIFILTSEPPENLGGMETFIREQVRGFEARAYSVRVFHRENSAPALWKRSKHRLSRHVADVADGFFIGRAAQDAMHGGVAAVISHAMVGWYPLSVPPNCKQLHFYHGTYRGYVETVQPQVSILGRWKMKWWDSMVLERFSGWGKQILCNSEQVRQEVRRYFGYDSSVSGLIVNQDFVPLDREESRRQLGLPVNCPVGIFVGSLNPLKGFDVVRALIERLPNVHWMLALRGTADESVLNAPNVRVIRDAPHASLAKLYVAADFSLCPSRYEAFGYVVAEALLCGTPVVATPGGASLLFLSEAPLNRFLIPYSGGVEEFESAVRALLQEPEKYRRAVLERVRPQVMQWTSPSGWWERFGRLTGLEGMEEALSGGVDAQAESCRAHVLTVAVPAEIELVGMK